MRHGLPFPECRPNSPASSDGNLPDASVNALHDLPVKVALIRQKEPENCDASMVYHNVMGYSHSWEDSSAISWEIGEATIRIMACQDYLALSRRELARRHITTPQYIERRTQTLDTLRFWHAEQRRLVAIDAARDAERLQQSADLLAATRKLIPAGWCVP